MNLKNILQEISNNLPDIKLRKEFLICIKLSISEEEKAYNLV